MADKMLSDTQIGILCSNIAMMLRAGTGSGEACSLFAQDAQGPAAEAARRISASMEQGATFAGSARSTGVFPAYALGVFETAEYSGRLEEAMDRLADYYERQHKLTARLRSTLSYPVALLLMMCGVLSVLVFSVLPMFRRVYDGLTGSLAASSYAYVAGAETVGKVSLLIAVAVAVTLLALAFAVSTRGGRERLRRPMERSRLTGEAARLMAVSRLADTLSILLASGTDPDSALRRSMALTEHTGLRASLAACEGLMEQGEGLAQSLFRNGVFPALYGRMLVTGSESGNLSAVLEQLSRKLGDEAEEKLGRLIDAAEPILLGFLTVSVGLTLLSVMLPLLGILSAL